jgi:hypothetical protein
VIGLGGSGGQVRMRAAVSLQGGEGFKRSFLTGSDRVGNGQAGLAWSETGNCAMADL